MRRTRRASVEAGCCPELPGWRHQPDTFRRAGAGVAQTIVRKWHSKPLAQETLAGGGWNRQDPPWVESARDAFEAGKDDA